MNTKDRWVLAKAIALYYYNVGSEEWADAFEKKLCKIRLSVGWHPYYRSEQTDKFRRGFQSHFGELDFERQQVQLQVVLDRYGAEAESAWHANSSLACD